MQVILKETVHNLGEAGKVVRVKDGYARNYLIPNDLAAPASSGMKRQIEHLQRLAEKRRATEIKSAEDMKERLEKLELTIEARAGEKEKLYGSVTSADIAEALAKEGIEIDRRKIVLENPIRVLGEHTVHVKVDPQVGADFKVNVTPSPDSHREPVSAKSKLEPEPKEEAAPEESAPEKAEKGEGIKNAEE